jgi:hypothetical protein
MRDPVSDVAQQVAAYSADPAVADHDQIGVELLSNSKEGVRRLPQACDRMHGNAGIVESHPCSADDLLRGDTLVVAEPRWYKRSPLGTYPHHRGGADRPIRHHDQNLSAGKACKLPRYIDRSISSR